MDVVTAESAQPLPETLWISRHTYWCRLRSTVIYLNLARDEYGTLTEPAQGLMSAIVPGWPLSAEGEAPSLILSNDQISKLRSELITAGVLTSDAAEGKRATPTRHTVANVALEPNCPQRRTMNGGDFLKFLAACTITAWSLRFRSLQDSVRALARNRHEQETSELADPDQIADLVAIFRRLRSFTFSGHRNCLFHAIALVRFLAGYGVHADFIMGVKVDPWAAHSWVQHGDYVVDGTPEQVRFYTPLLVV
jgi:hypothetical protein